MSTFDPVPHTSVVYLPVEVVPPIRNGVQIDPTGDDVAVAFVSTGTIPADEDFNDAIWNTSGSPTVYTALCLIGPGAVALDAGAYAVFVKVTDDPEVPVIPCPGILTIT